MKKFCTLLTFLILVGTLFVPAVSAEEIYNESVVDYSDTSQTVLITPDSYTHDFPDLVNYPVNKIRIRDVSSWDEVGYIVLDIPFLSGTYSGDNCPGWWVDSKENIVPGRYDFDYEYNGKSKPGVLYLERYTNLFGTPTHARFTIFLNDWDRDNLEGTQIVTLPFSVIAIPDIPSIDVGTINIENINQHDVAFVSDIYKLPNGRERYLTIEANAPSISIAKGVKWEQHLTVKKIDGAWYEITLDRAVKSILTQSTIQIYNDSVVVAANTGHGDTFTGLYRDTDIDAIKIISPSNREYYYNLGTDPDDPDDPGDPDTPVTIYAKNSQTGALIANAHINISASVNGTLHEVVNKTIPSGIYSIELQPTGGGKPNPDFYRLITTAEGYNSIMPYIDFEVDGATTIYAYLDPTGGAPEDENNTFIDFFVRDMSANPISGATVNFGGYTLITNSAGYTIFEVDKSKTYSWTVSKSGYGSVTGNAVIGSGARHTINTVLAPSVTPTIPTAIPTSTPISPTPTMTAPTGEPVSNWLEWFAAHFGMILGGGAEIGKIFMWLCFAVPVGVYVGKEAKAGAAGFMAGAGVVTLFFVLIGWVPIWLLVLLALIIGLLYAKVINNPDNGGGR